MSFKVFAVENNEPLSKPIFDTLMLSADAVKQQMILSKKIKSNADNSLIGIALAKYALIKVYGLHGKKLEFAYSSNGKPYLKYENNIHFNISHSGCMAVCAVSDLPVGIDVERTRRFNKSVSEKIFGTRKTKELLTLNDTDKVFTKLWTEKEAMLKLTGEGISGIRKNLNPNDFVLKTVYHNNYCITTATYK